MAFHRLELPYVFSRIPEGFYERIVLLLAPTGGCISTEPGPDEMDPVSGKAF